MVYKAEVIRIQGSKVGKPYIRYWSSSVKMKKSKKTYAKRNSTITIRRVLTAPERAIRLRKLVKK